ncbi:YusG family protein [Alkalihalobacillus oceani]|uniref:YusG family protein n=1 Tax=Halalkalibacter oceani TaxID=1653776 RepID=UPI00203C1B01|nr:YusG family protein [Halalkalibacter oceani]MCM3760516.1 YusG family protein [Halalkalibacter oceani]
MGFVRVDVTGQVKGKYEAGTLNLYIGDTQIGKVLETSQGLEHDMFRGYEFEQDKIYRYEQENPDQITSYVDNCEEGWC